MHPKAAHPKDEYEKLIVGSEKCMDQRRVATGPGCAREACRAAAAVTAR
jgi:hypothetical protein